MPFQHYRTTWQMSNARVVEQKDLGLGKSVNQNNIEFAQVADVVVDDVRKHWHRTFSILHPCRSLLSS